MQSDPPELGEPNKTTPSLREILLPEQARDGEDRWRDDRPTWVPEDLVQHCFGILLGRANDECTLRDQDLSGLCQDPLLSRRQASSPFSKGEVPDDLGHVADVAGEELG